MDTLYTRKESFLVVLDSRNATGINNSSMNLDLTYDLTDEIRLEKDTIQISMVVSSFTCPVSFYNINPSQAQLSTCRCPFDPARRAYRCVLFTNAPVYLGLEVVLHS